MVNDSLNENDKNNLPRSASSPRLALNNNNRLENVSYNSNKPWVSWWQMEYFFEIILKCNHTRSEIYQWLSGIQFSEVIIFFFTYLILNLMVTDWKMFLEVFRNRYILDP